jgi:hypothetical protein
MERFHEVDWASDLGHRFWHVEVFVYICVESYLTARGCLDSMMNHMLLATPIYTACNARGIVDYCSVQTASVRIANSKLCFQCCFFFGRAIIASGSAKVDGDLRFALENGLGLVGDRRGALVGQLSSGFVLEGGGLGVFDGCCGGEAEGDGNADENG